MLSSAPDFGGGGRPPVRAPLGAIPAGARILFAGDSITQGWDAGLSAPDATYRWCAPLETQLTAAFTAARRTPPTYTNTAISGQTSAAIAADVTAQIVTPAATDIFLQIGTNDVGFALTQAQTIAALRTILDAAIATVPTVRIRVLSLFFAGEKWPQGQNASDGAYDLRNSTILGVVNTYPAANVEWLWLRQLLMAREAVVNTPAPGAASGILTQDGTHLTKTANGGAEYVSSLVRSMISLAT